MIKRKINPQKIIYFTLVQYEDVFRKIKSSKMASEQSDIPTKILKKNANFSHVIFMKI